MPGQPKISSTTTAPPRRYPISSPITVTMGSHALRSMWRTTTADSAMPFALAVRTKSAIMTSSTLPRTVRVSHAVSYAANATAGNTRWCSMGPTPSSIDAYPDVGNHRNLAANTRIQDQSQPECRRRDQEQDKNVRCLRRRLVAVECDQNARRQRNGHRDRQCGGREHQRGRKPIENQFENVGVALYGAAEIAGDCPSHPVHVLDGQRPVQPQLVPQLLHLLLGSVGPDHQADRILRGPGGAQGTWEGNAEQDKQESSAPAHQECAHARVKLSRSPAARAVRFDRSS